MRWLIAIAGAVLGSVFLDEEGLLLGAGLGFLVGYVIEREQRRVRELQQRGARPDAPALTLEARLETLTARVAELERTVSALRVPAVSAPAVSAPAVSGPFVQPDERGWVPEPARVPEPALLPPPSATAEPVPLEAPRREPPVAADEPAPGPSWIDAARDWLWGGNTVVRAGVLVLTVGVGLLVKYAADNAILPVELRLALAAAIGLALVVLGYRLRTTRPGFGTALQGGGVAAIYLSTFFAYYAYHLLPGALTIGLLAAIAIFSTILAVVQSSVELAVFGSIGGFLAPVIASSGGGSHVALFSYYTLLNATIAASALYRAWRLLNWVGFLFTFGIASAWGALKYEPAQMASSAAFLALFFAFYVLVGTLFALRRPGSQRGTIDTTLTFGTPLATLALAGGLFHLEHLYLALWCVGMAAIYLAVAGLLLARKDAQLRDLAQAYLAVGIGVATLAIPFALENALGTALAWAAEASGLVWIGVRQQRLRTRAAGYVLFTLAVLSLAARNDLGDHRIHALFLALIAIGALFASACIERAPSLRSLERGIGRVLLVLGFALWLTGWQVLIAPGFAPLACAHTHALRLAAHAFDMLAFEWLGERLGFAGLRAYPRYGFAVLLALTLIGLDGNDVWQHVAWPLAILASYWPLYRQLTGTAPLHAISLWVIALWLIDLGHLVSTDLADGWQVALHLGPPLFAVALAVGGRPAWPFAEYTRAYRLGAALPILVLIELGFLLAQAASDGDPTPLPYLPLVNPLDLAQLFWVGAVLALARTPELERWKKVGYGVAGAGLFVGLNGTIVRTAHHWAGVPFREFDFPTDPLVQAAFSILWTVTALIAMLVANKRALRAPWMVGAGLLTVVVGKLFLLDLDGLSSGMKIITFLAVGVLLLLIGFFAPVPPAAAEPAR
ncbi:MAG TPA: DUF2339 domain-containing protein [Polyangiales bacterium]|nr:DUF2339 domain-containing protein [Polyangiales bacterium]